MTTILIVLAAAAQAYLLGSVDTGILISKYLYHDDVRSHGSGAAGMTNMLRTFGKKAAAMTAAGDVLKGVAAVCIGRWLFGFLPDNAAGGRGLSAGARHGDFAPRAGGADRTGESGNPAGRAGRLSVAGRNVF